MSVDVVLHIALPAPDRPRTRLKRPARVLKGNCTAEMRYFTGRSTIFASPHESRTRSPQDL